MSAADIVGALGGRPCGGGAWMVRCPLPTHGKGQGDQNPSVKITDDDRKRDGIDVVYFAGCDWRDIKAHFVSIGAIPHSDAGQAPTRPIHHPKHASVEPNAEARALWDKALPIADDKAASYLHARGLTLPAPSSLRYLPRLAYGGQHQLPVMVAAVQASDRRIIAVQVTWLDSRGDRKAQVAIPRKTIGNLTDGAVRLGPAGADIGLAEGVETALSAMQAFGIPCWAVLGCQRFGRIKLPSETRTVHLFADNDEPGRKSAHRAAQTYNAQGRTVVLRFPPDGFKDWNDVVRALKDEDAA